MLVVLNISLENSNDWKYSTMLNFLNLCKMISVPLSLKPFNDKVFVLNFKRQQGIPNQNINFHTKHRILISRFYC